MKTKRFLWILLPALALLASPRHASGQVKPDELVQKNFHRAESAWRNRTSLLEAKVRADHVLREAPDHADALKLRAEVLMAMGRYSEALQDADRAATLRPGDASAQLLLAEAARLSGDFARAGVALEQAAALAIEENADFHIQLSQIALLLGETDRAESYARVAHAKDRNYAPAYYQLARVFVEKERINDAVTTLLRGFRANLLDASYVRQDSTLGRLAGHQELDGYLNP